MNTLKPLDILVFKGNWWNPFHLLIALQSGSFSSHVAIYVGHGEVIEAQAEGVVTTPLVKYNNKKYKVYRYLHAMDTLNIIVWLFNIKKNNRGYDFKALLGFLLGKQAFEEENKWYCSELAYWMFQDNGYRLTKTDETFIYPNFFERSFHFKEVKYA